MRLQGHPAPGPQHQSGGSGSRFPRTTAVFANTAHSYRPECAKSEA